jgi:hypothetical protein
MTRAEAVRELKRVARGHTFNVQVQSWHHAEKDGNYRESTVFTVSLLPGLNGDTCTQWTGKNLETVVTDAVCDILEPARLLPPTPVDLDSHFEEKAAAVAVDLGASPTRSEADTAELPTFIPMSPASRPEPVLAGAGRTTRVYGCNDAEIPF